MTFNVAIGDVFYLKCNLCNPPKPKYFVVANVQPLRMFIINTHRTDYAEVRPRMVDASPEIHVADNPFLDHDSVVGCDCRPSHEYSYEALAQMVANDGSIYRGHLHVNSKLAIVTALANNHLMPQKYIKEMLPLWRESAGLPAE